MWHRVMAKRVIAKSLAALAVLFLLTGCVTEPMQKDRSQAKVASKEKRLNDYSQLAMGYLQAGKREQAWNAIEKGLALDSRSPEMHNAMAFYYSSGGEKELAEKTFHKALSDNSRYTATYLNFGAFLYSEKRYEEACKMFERASADVSYPRRADAFANYGVCLKALNRNKEAEDAFNRSIANDLTNPMPYLELAQLRFDQGEFAQSRQFYDKYVFYGQQTPRSLWLGIRLMHIFGDDDKKASYALYLKNQFPASQEYLDYKKWAEAQ